MTTASPPQTTVPTSIRKESTIPVPTLPKAPSVSTQPTVEPTHATASAGSESIARSVRGPNGRFDRSIRFPSSSSKTLLISCGFPELLMMRSIHAKPGDVDESNPVIYTSGDWVLVIETNIFQSMTNFSPFKGDSEKHPWMGWDRYNTAVGMLEASGDGFDVAECFELLRATSQTVCPTVVSMVFDVSARTVHWCEDRNWDKVESRTMVSSR